MSKIHILGICGTFMGGIAAIARQMGHQITGSDQNIYPPMSTQLEQLGIKIHHGYDAEPLSDDLDMVIVGNVMTRGMKATEYVLEQTIPYSSGPQWLGEQVLRHKTVYAVAGTHGKTTTSSMLAWVFEDQGIDPGFLIGGVCHHFNQSARITDSNTFVIEADEYDSAFFDKRSKFIHYRSNVVILNNLEFDHADIFDNLADIKKQFHHLIRTIPQNGLLVVNHDDQHLKSVLAMGSWTPVVTFGTNQAADYWISTNPKNPQQFHINKGSQRIVSITWNIPGQHNQLNALAAILAAQKAGISIEQSAHSLSQFKSVKRRMEYIGTAQNITVYDDFAHHPTAIETTIAGAKATHPNQRIVVVIEPRSNSMRAGAHAKGLVNAISQADICIIMKDPTMTWDADIINGLQANQVILLPNTSQIIERLLDTHKAGDIVIFMSNGGFNNVVQSYYQIIHQPTL